MSGGSPDCATTSPAWITATQSASTMRSIPAARTPTRSRARRLRHRRAQGERGETRIGAVLVDHPDALDGHAVDRVDLRREQRDQVLVGQRDHEFVDRPAGAVFEDLDRQHVAAHGPDTARHLAERARAVGHPDSDDDGDHGRQGSRGTSLSECTITLRQRVTSISPALGRPRLDPRTRREAEPISDRRQPSFGRPRLRLRIAWCDALLVLDQREADEALAAGAEADARRQRDVGLADDAASRTRPSPSRRTARGSAPTRTSCPSAWGCPSRCGRGRRSARRGGDW